MGMMHAILVLILVQVFVNGETSSLNDVTSFRARMSQPKENASYAPSTGINNTLTTNFNSTKKALDFHDKKSVVHCDIVLSRGPLFQALLPTRSRCFMGRQ